MDPSNKEKEASTLEWLEENEQVDENLNALLDEDDPLEISVLFESLLKNNDSKRIDTPSTESKKCRRNSPKGPQIEFNVSSFR